MIIRHGCFISAGSLTQCTCFLSLLWICTHKNYINIPKCQLFFISEACSLSQSCGPSSSCVDGRCLCNNHTTSQSSPSDGTNCFSYRLIFSVISKVFLKFTRTIYDFLGCRTNTNKISTHNIDYKNLNRHPLNY